MGSAHIIRTRSGIVPPKTAIYWGQRCGKLPSINATYARHKPTIMSGSVPQKSYVALQAHLNTLMFPRKFLIGNCLSHIKIKGKFMENNKLLMIYASYRRILETTYSERKKQLFHRKGN